MTAILDKIRDLDAQRDRGDLTVAQYASRRAAVLGNVEDAETKFIDITPVEAPVAPRKSGSSAIGFGLVVCLMVMGLCISLTLLFLPDINLALTLGVTILAALSVALLQESGE